MSDEIEGNGADKRTRALLVIANPATSTTLGIPVGFWVPSSRTAGLPLWRRRPARRAETTERSPR
jgi:hypothetical protein